MRYPADPPTVEEIIAVMRQAGDGVHALRARGLIAVLWRAGLRIDEALQLAESDLDEARGSLIVRHGKGDKRREVGMDQWGWEHVRAWLTRRGELPVGPLFCVILGDGLVGALRDAGLSVTTGTVNDAAIAERALAYAPDALTTDRPHGLAAELAARRLLVA